MSIWFYIWLITYILAALKLFDSIYEPGDSMGIDIFLTALWPITMIIGTIFRIISGRIK